MAVHHRRICAARPGSSAPHGMTPVFVDTSAWYAIADRTDTDHASAVTILQRLSSLRARLVTTGHVLAEFHRLALYRSNRRAALEAARRIAATPRVELVHADEQDLTAGLAWIDRFTDQDFTLTDAISFAVMDRLDIGQAFAFDRDFAIAGFELLGS